MPIASQFVGESERRFVSRLVAVVSDQHALNAVFPERRAVVVGEAVDAIARGHIAKACAPERQRVDERFAQNDLFRGFQRLLVPYAAVRARQVEMQRRARPQSRR